MKYTPHQYQAYCTSQIIDKPTVALWVDMGLGKTVSTLQAILDLKYYRFAINKVLVIAPKKVAEATWTDEIAKWDNLSLLRASVVIGTQNQRIKALAMPADIYVISRDSIVWLVDYYRNAWPFDMVVIDEASSFKSHQAQRFKALKAVRNKIQRMVELTGTPAPHGLLDLWAQIFLLDGGDRLGKTISGYRSRYFSSDTHGGHFTTYSELPTSFDAVQEALSDICVSMKANDYLHLPELITDDIPVMLDNKARKAYEILERNALLQIDDQTIDAGTAAVLTNKLLQLANGAVYDEMQNIAEIHDCKIQAFMELIEQLNGQHALVFYNFKHDLSRLEKALAKSGLNVRLYKSDEDKQAWNRGEVDILLAHPASCAYGLNLQQGGHHVIWFGLTWSLELYQQAIKRLHRQGQELPVIVHRLIVKDTADEDVVTVLEGRAKEQDGLMTALKARIHKIKEGKAI